MLQNKLSARGVRAASSSRRVVVVKAVAAPEAAKTLNTTRSDQVRFLVCDTRDSPTSLILPKFAAAARPPQAP
jgi:hypothetical protein